MDDLLTLLAQRRGIGQEYTDIWGKTSQTSTETKHSILTAMGYPLDDAKALEALITKEDSAFWQTALDPVYVLRNNQTHQLHLRLSANNNHHDAYKWRIHLEDGNVTEYSFLLSDCENVNKVILNEQSYFEYIAFIQQDIPLGYHILELLTENNNLISTSSLIIAPSQCFQPELTKNESKCWGPSVQLYTLRSENNWGIGDFSDLKQLLCEISSLGGDFVGLNPIHALYPANPDSCSPYSPSSRRWLNTIYIDVAAVPEFCMSQAVCDEFNATDKQQLAALREAEWVDYKAVYQLKLKWLKEAFLSADLSANSERGARFQEFIIAGGESLLQIAAFDALQQTFYNGGMEAWGPPVWPEPYQDFYAPAVQTWIATHPLDIKFYQYLQWIAAEQLAETETLAKALEMKIGVYRDLAVGVSEGSCEIWANKNWYCAKASVGAPPDPLGPQGQNWGLPPLDPVKLKSAAYQPFIDLLRANMAGCGALRIDHVMGLKRLWWVPPGESAKKGAYVFYPVEDMLAILSLESVRHRCMVIGEDLGTVPPEMRTLLKENGIYSYKVFFFERAEDGGFFSPAHYPYQAMSALTTHDMPTLRGFWHCDDLSLGRDLGLYPDEDVLQDLYRERHHVKQAILDSLKWHGVLPEGTSKDVSWVGMSTELSHALQEHMSKGHCALFSTQLEDWLEMDKPVNVPGTSQEYPNWRRKLSRNLKDIFSDPKLIALAGKMTNARKNNY